jgi:hypothetical protein
MIKLEELKKEVTTTKFMTTFIVIFIILYIFVSFIKFLGNLPVLIILCVILTFYINKSKLIENSNLIYEMSKVKLTK